MASYLSKVADFNPPHLHFGAPPEFTAVEFRGDFWRQKTRLPGLSSDVVCLILSLSVLAEHRLVADRHRQAHSIYGASIASRGKNQYKAMRRRYAKSLDNETVQSVLSRGPSYKISYDSLTIIL